MSLATEPKTTPRMNGHAVVSDPARLHYETTSQKGRIMEHLRERALGDRPFSSGARDTHAAVRRKGFTGATIKSIGTALGYSSHDVTHALYDLRNRGLIRFQTSKTPGRHGADGTGGNSKPNGIPVRISVTPAGLAMSPSRLVRQIIRIEREDMDVVNDILGQAPTVSPLLMAEPVTAAPSTPLLDHIRGIEPDPEPEPEPGPEPATESGPSPDPRASPKSRPSPWTGGSRATRSSPGWWPVRTPCRPLRNLLRSVGRTELADLVTSENKLSPLELEVLAFATATATAQPAPEVRIVELRRDVVVPGSHRDPTPLLEALAEIVKYPGSNMSATRGTPKFDQYTARINAVTHGREVLAAWTEED